MFLHSSLKSNLAGYLPLTQVQRHVYFTHVIYRCNLMRAAPYDLKAAKQTVSLTLNSDLYAQARRFGINTSQIAEEALAQEVARRNAEQLREEVRKDLAALDAYEAENGSFAEMVRQHYQSGTDDVP